MKIEHTDGRFYIKTDHGEAELTYRINGNKIDMYHTFTPPEDRGKGIAKELVLEALKFTKERDLKVIPGCPYVKHFLDTHEEYSDYVASE